MQNGRRNGIKSRAQLFRLGKMNSELGFADRLRSLFGESEPFAQAKRMGINGGTFDRIWNGGKIPKSDTLLVISRHFGVTVDWLLTGDGPVRQNDPADTPKLTPIPRYDLAASAGGGAVIDAENVKETIAFRTDWLREEGLDPKQLNVISVMGDSMEPSLYNGDIILIDRRDGPPRSGCVYVINYDGDLLVKRLQRLLNGGFKIISDNPRYEPETIPAEQMEQVRIIGRVVWKGGRMV